MSKIKKEFYRFLVAGFSAVGADFMAYYFLLNFLSIDLAKVLSFIVGTVLAFLMNKYWTFEKYERSYNEIWKFVLLYTTSLFANVMINRLVIDLTQIVFFAFLMATGISAFINFIGQKFWVFK